MKKQKKPKNNQSVLIASIIALCIGFGIGISGFISLDYYNKGTPQIEFKPSSKNENNSKIEVCFTPPAGCANVIVREISQAEESIYVQAYGMSSAPIASALIKARLRGVAVKMLLDKSNLNQDYSKMHELRAERIEVGIDRVSGIAHNKVMIIDEKRVITGSFNFTTASDKRNTENVIIIQDRNVAKKYLQNWHNRRQQNQLNRNQ